MRSALYLLAGLAACGCSGPVDLPTAQAAAESPTQVSDARAPETNVLTRLWSRGRAQGRGAAKLKNFLFRSEDLEAILPMGMMVWGHVTPSDHLSLHARDRNAPKGHYPVMAPADGFLVDIQRPPAGNPDPGVRQYAGEYRLVVEHSSTFYTWFGLVDRLDPSILEAIGGEPPAGPPVGMRIPVKAGQTIAWSGGSHGLDFTVIDTEKTRTGFVDLTQFNTRDPWKPHVADPYDYVEEPLRAKLLALNPRTAAPRGGRIDYDVDGRLSGSWYRSGSGGYAGLNRRMDYWIGHLAFAYHHVVPSLVVVSIGDFQGQPRQFGVRGNGPDPKEVSVEDGLVRYELTYLSRDNSGRKFDQIDTNRVLGTALVQVLPDRQIRFEVFPGLNSADVRGFTGSARIFTR